LPVIARLTFGHPIALGSGESKQSLLSRAHATLDDTAKLDSVVS
jgi:hypothetical protein